MKSGLPKRRNLMTDPISDKKKYEAPTITILCGKKIRTMDNNLMPCVRPKGHQDGCNPFSNTTPQIKRDK